jgi:hypothetical protein
MASWKSLTGVGGGVKNIAGVTTNTGDSSYGALTLGFFMTDTGGTQIWINGSAAPNITGLYTGNAGTWSATTQFSLTYDGTTVRWYMNGGLVYYYAYSSSSAHSMVVYPGTVGSGITSTYFSIYTGGSAGATGAFGPATFLWSNVTGNGSVTQLASDRVRCTSASGYNVKFGTVEAYASGVSLTTRVSSDSSNAIWGLATNPISDYGNIAFAFRGGTERGPGNFYVWISGTEILPSIGTNAGTQFRITYDGAVARWYSNSTLVYSYVSNITSPLYFAANIGASPYEFSNVQFTPFFPGTTSPLVVLETSATSLTLASSNANRFFYLTNSGFNALTLPSSTNQRTDGGSYWSLRNATGSSLSITLTNTLNLTSPLVIPSSNTQTLAVSYDTSNTILLL